MERRREKYRHRSIGPHMLRPETLMMGYGYDSAALGGSSQAPGLPHVHLRLPHGRGGEGVFRSGVWPQGTGPGRTSRPHILSSQQSRPRDTGGPPHAVGRCRGGSDLLQRHVRDIDDIVDLRAPRRRHPAQRADLRRHAASCSTTSSLSSGSKRSASRQALPRPQSTPLQPTPGVAAASPPFSSRRPPTRRSRWSI
jgi:hypothetical protein